MDFFRDIVLVAARQTFGAAAGGGAELITNGGFDSGDNWTLANGAAISGGELSLGTFSTAVQTLAAGSQPAGNYTLTIDIAGANPSAEVNLLGAGDEVRATGSGLLGGAGQIVPLTADGEVTKIRIFGYEDSINLVDNVSLVAA
jgi:hypothetical protein